MERWQRMNILAKIAAWPIKAKIVSGAAAGAVLLTAIITPGRHRGEQKGGAGRYRRNTSLISDSGSDVDAAFSEDSGFSEPGPEGASSAEAVQETSAASPQTGSKASSRQGTAGKGSSGGSGRQYGRQIGRVQAVYPIRGI